MILSGSQRLAMIGMSPATIFVQGIYLTYSTPYGELPCQHRICPLHYKCKPRSKGGKVVRAEEDHPDAIVFSASLVAWTRGYVH